MLGSRPIHGCPQNARKKFCFILKRAVEFILSIRGQKTHRQVSRITQRAFQSSLHRQTFKPVRIIFDRKTTCINIAFANIVTIGLFTSDR